jgi:hypothetical protein
MEQDGIVVLHLTVLMADLLGRVMVMVIGLLSGVVELLVKVDLRATIG